MPGDIKDKNGEPIKEGEEVFTKIRGGTHTGTVEKIVTTKEEAEEEGVKNPPKVSCSGVTYGDMLPDHVPGALYGSAWPSC